MAGLPLAKAGAPKGGAAKMGKKAPPFVKGGKGKKAPKKK